MKHPAMARIFSIVLVIMSLIVFFAGRGQLSDAAEYSEACDKTLRELQSKLDNYDNALRELDNNRIMLNRLSDGLEQVEQEYSERAAAHKSEVAEYTTTAASILSGTEMLEQMSGAIYSGNLQLEEGEASFREGEEIFNKVYDTYETVKTTVEQSRAEYENAIAQARAQKAQVEEEYALALEEGDEERANELKLAIDAANEAEARYNELIAQLDIENAAQKADSLVQQAKTTMDSTRSQLDYAKSMISQARVQLSQSRKDMQKTQAEQAERLEKLIAEKAELEALNEKLSTKRDAADRLDAMEADLESAERKLMANDNIEARVNEGMELSRAAKEELDVLSADFSWGYRLRYYIAVAMMAGIIGVFSMVYSFEWVKGRWAMFPSFVCLILTAGAEAASVHYGLGQNYAALFTAIFAFAHCLIILPKAKKA